MCVPIATTSRRFRSLFCGISDISMLTQRSTTFLKAYILLKQILSVLSWAGCASATFPLHTLTPSRRDQQGFTWHQTRKPAWLSSVGTLTRPEVFRDFCSLFSAYCVRNIGNFEERGPNVNIYPTHDLHSFEGHIYFGLPSLPLCSAVDCPRTKRTAVVCCFGLEKNCPKR